MFSSPSVSEWINALNTMVFTVGIIIGVSMLVAVGIIKVLADHEESQDEKAKGTAPTFPKKTRTAA